MVHVCHQYARYVDLTIKVSISKDKGHDFLDKTVSIWHTHWGDLILPLFDNCNTTVARKSRTAGALFFISSIVCAIIQSTLTHVRFS